MQWTRTLAALCALAVGPVIATVAQPFSSVEVELAGQRPVTAPELEEGWDVSYGAGGALRFPFYAGEIAVGGRWAPHEARRADLPDFHSRYFYTEWTLPALSFGRLSLHAGGQIGLYQMRFDEAFVGGAQRIEQEVGLFGVASARFRHGPWAVHLGGGIGSLLLSDPVSPRFLSIGLSRRFALPTWLQEVIR